MKKTLLINLCILGYFSACYTDKINIYNSTDKPVFFASYYEKKKEAQISGNIDKLAPLKTKSIKRLNIKRGYNRQLIASDSKKSLKSKFDKKAFEKQKTKINIGIANGKNFYLYEYKEKLNISNAFNWKIVQPLIEKIKKAKDAIMDKLCKIPAFAKSAAKHASKLDKYATDLFSNFKDPYNGKNESDNVPEKTVGLIFESDLHFDVDPKKSGKQNKRKKEALKPLINTIKDDSQNVAATIIAGDMVDWGRKANWEKFEKEYLEPLKAAKKPVYFTMGNHDWYGGGENKESGYLSFARKKIIDTFGQLFYRAYEGGINIISLGMSPCKKEAISKYGKDKMPAMVFFEKLIKEKKIGKNPIILFFHYNLLGDYSYWWKKEEMEEFSKILNKYKKIKDKIILIVTGHYHYSYGSFWRGIPVICVGGDQFGLVKYNHKNKKLIVDFVEKNGKIKKWDPEKKKDFNPRKKKLTERNK